MIFFLSTNVLISQTNTSPSQTVCAGSLSEPYLINPPTLGSTYQWTLSGGGILNLGTSSDNITVDWGINPGVYTISVTETDVNGCIGLPVTVDVTVNPLPTATIATSQTVCFGSPIPDLFAIGSNVTWYSDINLTSQVGIGNNFATGQTSIGLYTYYVTETLNGCEGPAVPVTLEIYSVPAIPTSLSQTVCFGSNVPDLTALGNNITWYSDLSLSNIVGNGNNFSTGQTAIGVYSFYVTSTDLNGCESSSNMVSLEILSLPSPPTVSNQTACIGSVIPDLTATGSNISWYSDQSLSNLVGTGNTLVTGHNSVGIYTYYATTTNTNGCESIGVSSTLEIYDLPNPPISNNVVACVGGTVPDLVSSGNNINWYSDISLNNLIGTGNNLTTGQTLAGVYTYYATETNINGCESAPTTVTLTINSFNSLPIAPNVSACFNSSIPDLTATGIGNSFTWYSDASLTNIVGTNSPYSTGQTSVGIYTYYVTETQNGCQSPSTVVTLEIYALPNTGPINHW